MAKRKSKKKIRTQKIVRTPQSSIARLFTNPKTYLNIIVLVILIYGITYTIVYDLINGLAIILAAIILLGIIKVARILRKKLKW